MSRDAWDRLYTWKLAVTAIHVLSSDVLPYVWASKPPQVHDATLELFINDRLSQGASATTINRALEVVRTILNRAAGVSAEDREALLGHANHSMAGHYASPDVGRLLAQANLIVDRSGTRTLLRIAEHQCGRVDKSSHRVPQQRKEDLVLHAKSFNRIEAARTGG